MSATDHTLTAPERENIEELLRLHVLADDEQIVYDLFETLLTQRGVTYEARLATAEAEKEALRAEHRDLVSRLGFGDNIAEPMADNDTIVEWVEALGRDANEWGESQAWRIDCALAGHPDDEDCHEHDPSLAAGTAEAALAGLVAAVEALHRPIRVYNECKHDADHGCEPVEVHDYMGCSESVIGWGCSVCCYDDEYPREDCPHGADHTNVSRENACPTLALTADHAAALRAREAKVLRDAADEIDRGPTFLPLPPGVISAMIRERADSIEQARP